MAMGIRRGQVQQLPSEALFTKRMEDAVGFACQGCRSGM